MLRAIFNEILTEFKFTDILHILDLYTKLMFEMVKIYTTRISGPYGPLFLALAEGWLDSLTRGFATLNHWRGLAPFPSLRTLFLSLTSNIFFAYTG